MFIIINLFLKLFKYCWKLPNTEHSIIKLLLVAMAALVRVLVVYGIMYLSGTEIVSYCKLTKIVSALWCLPKILLIINVGFNILFRSYADFQQTPRQCDLNWIHVTFGGHKLNIIEMFVDS